MLRIREVKTASGATAVQLVYYLHRKRIIFKHVGSAQERKEIDELRVLAQGLINQHQFALPFEQEIKMDHLLHVDRCEFRGVYYSFLYNSLQTLLHQIGFGHSHPLLLDLVMVRLIEPASKLRSIELLDTYFGITHRRQDFYHYAPQWLTLKAKTEAQVVAFAQKKYAFDFSLLFYDVTTLYFETFQEDDLRKNGFSKDNKSQQPQIVVALLVTQEGFPIAYEVFAGNTFEGHTMLPVMDSLMKKYGAKALTVVADAAMISTENSKRLNAHGLQYIVGARIGNLPENILQHIDKTLPREDGKNIRLQTDKGHLICSYSAVRYRKDKHEMEKQIEKAKALVETPAKGKKVKFTQHTEMKIELHEALIEKTKKMLGIKGYYTNVEEKVMSNALVIERYHNLYRIEQAFRMSKSDLQTRPIFHFKEQPIKLHLLICFMALAVSKHIELATGDSIKSFITECKKITDARLFNTLTRKELKMRVKYSERVLSYIHRLNLPH